AEDGIRDFHVTGVQTCALPISATSGDRRAASRWRPMLVNFVELLGEWIHTSGWHQWGRWPTTTTRSTWGMCWWTVRSIHRSGSEIGRASCRERVVISVAEG